MVGCRGDFSGTQKLLQGLPDMSNARVLALRKCQIWGQESIYFHTNQIDRSNFLTFYNAWHGLLSQGTRRCSCELQRRTMTYFMMWAMEGMGVNVLVVSLDQPIVVGTGTDGLGGPTQSTQ